jgi:hypothetical protein
VVELECGMREMGEVELAAFPVQGVGRIAVHQLAGLP